MIFTDQTQEIEKVFFHLINTKNIDDGPGVFEPLIFDSLGASNPDNIYDMDTGKLTIPVSGYFYFDFNCHSLCCGFKAYTKLIVGSEEVSSSWVYDTGNYEIMSFSAVTFVSEGTEVYVEVYWQQGYAIAGHVPVGCTFSGFMISGI